MSVGLTWLNVLSVSIHTHTHTQINGILCSYKNYWEPLQVLIWKDQQDTLGG